MVKRGITSAFSLSALLLSVAAVSASDSPSKVTQPVLGPNREAVGQARPAVIVGAKSVETKAPAASAAQPEARPAEKPKTAKTAQAAIGDAFIAQNAVRVYLGLPLTISVHNARGQLLYHIESGRPMEVLPLTGVNTGFLYVTLRAGQLELTKKLVYSGK